MSRILPLLIPMACLSTAAFAADAQLTITDPGGHPLADAVVSAYPVGGKRVLAPAGGPYRMAQQGVSFRPFVLIVPVGANVSFPNLDRVRHQVYSFSTPKRFELKLYGRDESHSVMFDRPGTVALGCNIHDAMAAFIRVVDTPFAAKSGADGQLSLSGMTPGTVRLLVWHPRLKARGGELEMQIAVPATGLRQTLTIPVRAG